MLDPFLVEADRIESFGYTADRIVEHLDRVRQLITDAQPSSGDGGAERSIELRVQRRRILEIDGKQRHLTYYTS